jgi:hypothetical protein
LPLTPWPSSSRFMHEVEFGAAENLDRQRVHGQNSRQ